MTSSPDSKRAAGWQLGALLGAVALVLLAAFPYFEQVHNANELPRLIQAMSLVEQGEWAIDGASRRDLQLGPDIAHGSDGRMYPNKPPGASVVGALGFAVARLGSEPPTLREFTWWARLFAGIVPTLIIVAIAWGRLRQLYSPSIVAATIFLCVFGTPLFSYARLFYGHALAACLVYAGVVFIERGSAEPLDRTNGIQLGLGALLASAAITVEYGAAFAGIPIAAMLAWPLFDRRLAAQADLRSVRLVSVQRAAIALGCALIPVALLAVYHRAAFGSAFATGYHNAVDPGFAALHGQGLLGLGAPRWENVVTHIFSLDGGLLVWSPLVVPGVIGLLRIARRRDPHTRAARLQLAIFMVFVLMGLGLSFDGGWRVGPRYMVVAFPMLMLGLAEFMTRWRDDSRPSANAAMLGLLGFCAVWSLIANSLAATLWPHLDLTNIAEPFGAVLLPLWQHGLGPYGLPSMFGGGLVVSGCLPVALGLGTLIRAIGFARAQTVLLPMFFAIAAGTVALLFIVPRSVVAHPQTERNLEYIERVYEPRVQAGQRVPGPTRVLD